MTAPRPPTRAPPETPTKPIPPAPPSRAMGVGAASAGDAKLAGFRRTPGRSYAARAGAAGLQAARVSLEPYWKRANRMPVAGMELASVGFTFAPRAVMLSVPLIVQSPFT